MIRCTKPTLLCCLPSRAARATQNHVPGLYERLSFPFVASALRREKCSWRMTPTTPLAHRLNTSATVKAAKRDLPSISRTPTCKAHPPKDIRSAQVCRRHFSLLWALHVSSSQPPSPHWSAFGQYGKGDAPGSRYRTSNRFLLGLCFSCGSTWSR